jgi:hypothetical protein
MATAAPKLARLHRRLAGYRVTVDKRGLDEELDVATADVTLSDQIHDGIQDGLADLQRVSD